MHEDAFGYFQFEITRRQAGLLQDPCNAIEKPRVPELHRSNIDRHRHGAKARIQPGLNLPAGLAQYPLTDRHDEAALFRERHKLLRRDEPGLRGLPANKRLGTGHCAGNKVDLRLVMQQELPHLQGTAQAAFDEHPADRAGIHVGLEKLVVVTAARLGVIHRGIRVLHQRADVDAVIRKTLMPMPGRFSASERRITHSTRNALLPVPASASWISLASAGSSSMRRTVVG